MILFRITAYPHQVTPVLEEVNVIRIKGDLVALHVSNEGGTFGKGCFWEPMHSLFKSYYRTRPEACDVLAKIAAERVRQARAGLQRALMFESAVNLLAKGS